MNPPEEHMMFTPLQAEIVITTNRPAGTRPRRTARAWRTGGRGTSPAWHHGRSHPDRP